MTPAPGLLHQRIVTDLVTRLNSFVKAHDLGRLYAGPVDVLFAEGDYLEPDIVFVREDRSSLLSDRGIEGPPDLVVEVLSPSTASRDRGIKLERYRHYGVSEYWVVDPAVRAIEVWKLAGAGTEPVMLVAEDTLRWQPTADGPALEAPVAEIFGKGR